MYETTFNRGVFIPERLPNGSLFSYGRDHNSKVSAITHSTETGEENSTTQLRTLGMVTEVKSGNNAVRYAYDEKRRVKSVSLNGTESYVTYTYSGENTNAETVKATMVDGSLTKTWTNAHGNTTHFVCQCKKKDVNGNMVDVTAEAFFDYDKDQKLTEVEDSKSDTLTQYHYNTDGNVEKIEHIDKNDCTVKYNEAYVYDSTNKSLVTEKTFSGNGISQTYQFAYKSTADRSLNSITVDGKMVRPNTDALGRNVGKTIEIDNVPIAEEKISYVKFGDHATNLPSTVRFATNGVFNESIQYKYDSMGNIIEVFENGRSVCRYEYDALNRLTREDNVAFEKTTTWAYDNNGNIIAKYEYVLTAKPTSELHLLNCTIFTYCYDDNSDQLLSITKDDGSTVTTEFFEYDAIGNPETYRGEDATWQYGRQLATYKGHTFSYDARGRRTGKNNITFTYDSNGNLIKQSNGLEFLYDHTGVFAIKKETETYFYRKDTQANIVELLDSNGDPVVKYKYDAWGNCVVDASTTNTTLANLNPFRYRSYYYDTETKLYYLQTRYYDPEIGRFMTIDDLSYLDPNRINGLNLYAYCLNNPITYSDPTGHSATLAIILGIVALAGLITTCIGVRTNNNIVTAIGLTMVAVPALISGGLALVGGITAGATLTAIVGGVTTVAGIGTSLFASAEYQEAFTGNNWILATTGMSDGMYNGLMITIAALAMLGTFASSFAYNFNIKSVDKVGKLRPQNHPDEGYFGVRFKDARGSLKSIEIQKHTPHGLHFQLNSWNPMHMSVKTIRRWTWYLTRM